MMRSIIFSSLRLRRLIVAVAAAAIVFVVVQLGNVSRDLLPEFSPTRVEVQTEALGLSAEEVEQFITVPLEQDLLIGVAFLEDIESASLPGLSSIVLTFEPGTDILDARQVVAERLAQAVTAAGLPQVADSPQMLQPLSSTSRVAMVSLTSDELSPIETSVLARWVVVPRLLGVQGVANVAIWGFKDRQLQVLVDPVELAEQDVELSQILSTAGNALQVSPLSFLEASSPGTGGFIDTVNQRLHIFHEQAISTPDELARAALEGPDGGAVLVDGEPVTLGDVTEIVEDHQPLIGDAQCNAGPCVLLVIEKFPGANTPEVVENIDIAFEALAPGLGGIEIDTSVYRPAVYVEEAIDNLRAVLIVGGLILLIVLGLIFASWRIVLIAVLSVVSSLAVVGLVFYFGDVTLNSMTMAGVVLALGLITADAVMTSWGVVHDTARERAESTGPLWSRVIADSLLRVRTSLAYGGVIAALASVPVFFMDEEGGAFLPSIAGAYLLGILASVLVGLIVTTALSGLVLERGAASYHDSTLIDRLRTSYRGILERVATKTSAAVAVFAVFVGAAIVAVPFIDQALRPSLEERDILIAIDAPVGTSLPRMDELTSQIVDDLGDVAGIDGIGAHVGRAIQSDQIVNVNSAEIWIRISEEADYTATIRQIEVIAAQQPDVSADVTTYSDQRVTEVLGGDDDRLVVRVYGENPATLESTANEVLAAISTVDGVESPRLELPAEEPTIEVEVDLDRARAVGLKPGDVRRTAAILLSGVVVGNLFEEQKVFDVVVWGDPELRQTEADVRDLPITTPSGGQVPLGEVADVRVVPNPAVIRHESGATYLDVTAGVQGRDVGSVAADIEAATSEIPFPIEHRAVVLGGFNDNQTERTRVLAVTAAVLIAMALLFQAAFASWRLAVLAILTLPMAVAGGILAMVLTGSDLTLGAIAALVALVGFGASGIVMLLRRYQYLRRIGAPFGDDLILDGAGQVAPPLIALFAGLVALYLPLAMVGSGPGLEIVSPMAVVLLGGLVSTSLLTLYVIPVFYHRWGLRAELDTLTDDLFELDLTEVETVRS